MKQVRMEFQARRREELEKLIWGCWALWCERNQQLWQKSFSSTGQFMMKAQTFVLGWSQAQLARMYGKRDNHRSDSSWRRPAGGRLKPNVDATVKAEKCGFGWCLRDEDGSFVAGATKPWLGRLSPLDAELIGIREVLSWLQETD
ncbi:unnamed protein product [Cuscuta europaea]|nr:unnamed protein product [Cuscuta europaea]